MKRRTYAALALMAIWLLSYLYMLLITGDVNFFVPSFAGFLSWISFMISPYKNTKPFLAELRLGRAFYSVLLAGLPALFSGGSSSPNWTVLPGMFGLFLLTSALINRIDVRR